MKKSVRNTPRRSQVWIITTSVLIICLSLCTSSSIVFGLSANSTKEVIPEQLESFELPTDSNSPKSNPNTPNEVKIEIGDGVEMEFALIPAGEFEMGSPAAEQGRNNDEGPVHRIGISKPFYMGKYEVTQEQYYVVAKYKPSRFKQESGPVENVSWEQADRFCKKLSQMKNNNFRLPTEAEWEFACRAGSQNRFYFGPDPKYSQIKEYAWYSKNSDSLSHVVGEKKPNAFGLYDMHGNVQEWCKDWYAENYYLYHQILRVDPTGPAKGKERVIRGGSWFDSARKCRSACRSKLEPIYIRNNVGFRVVLEIE